MIGVNVNEFETKNLKERMDKEKMNWRSFAHQDAINAKWNPSTPGYYVLDPRGVIVVVEAEHLCMAMRGVRKPGAMTVTSAVRGMFQADPRTRAEAMSLVLGR